MSDILNDPAVARLASRETRIYALIMDLLGWSMIDSCDGFYDRPLDASNTNGNKNHTSQSPGELKYKLNQFNRDNNNEKTSALYREALEFVRALQVEKEARALTHGDCSMDSGTISFDDDETTKVVDNKEPHIKNRIIEDNHNLSKPLDVASTVRV